MDAPLGRVVLAREGGGGGLVDAPLGRVVLAREGGGGRGLGGCSTGKSGVSQRGGGALVDAPLGRVVLAREGGGGGAWWLLLWEEWC